jgi:hypothetical protein
MNAFLFIILTPIIKILNLLIKQSNLRQTIITTIIKMNIGNGTFDYIPDSHCQKMYANAHKAITQCELWNWLANAADNDEIWLSNEFLRIHAEMVTEPVGRLHSGSSMALTMRIMRFISKNGYDKLQETFETEQQS